MNKTIFFVLASILLLGMGFVTAEQGAGNGSEQGQMIGEMVQTMNQLQTGTYNAGEGNQIQVQARENNRIGLKSGNVEAQTGLEVTSDGQKLMAKLSNGRNAEIKVMPDVASETALQRLRLRVCTEDRNCSIELKQVGEGEQARLAYELQTQRQSRVFGLFKAQMNVRAQVDAENGEVIRIGKPWWAFLATEPEE